MNRIKPQQKWLTDIIEGLLPQSLKWLIAQGYVELERDGDLTSLRLTEAGYRYLDKLQLKKGVH